MINEETISNLEKDLQIIKQKENDLRIIQIDNDLKKGILDFDSLNDNEAIYLHSRLHFFNSFKKQIIPKDKLVEYHNKILSLLKNHTNYDDLDKNL